MALDSVPGVVSLPGLHPPRGTERRAHARDERTGTLGLYPITDRISHEDEQVVKLTLDGEVLTTTPEHPFYVDQHGWMPAQALTAGLRVRKADGGFEMVHALALEHQPQRMYNLTVEGAHTFFVGDGKWLVHNAGCSIGRMGKQARLKQLAGDDKLSSAHRGWLKQEIDAMERGSRDRIRVPPGTVLAHRRGFEARNGFGYEYADLQGYSLHMLQHRWEGYAARPKYPPQPKLPLPLPQEIRI